MSLSNFLDSALYLANLNLSVFPIFGILEDGTCTCSEGSECENKGKHPTIANWQMLATTEEKKIKRWATKYPNANVGIATGKKSSLTVLDVDGEEGYESIRQFEEQYGSIPETVIVKTGSGGLHYYFTYCSELANSVKNLPGLDIRNDGGYVVAPSSKHELGTYYEFVVSLDQAGFAEFPRYILNALREAYEEKKKKHKTVFDEGERNSGLFSVGIALWNRGRTIEEVQTYLEKINETSCVPPLDDKEVRGIVKSIANCEPEMPSHDSEVRRNIVIGLDQIREIADVATSALVEKNQRKETLFHNQNTLIQVHKVGDELFSRAMNLELMLSELVRHSNWYRATTKGGYAPTDPTEKVAKLLLTDIDSSTFRNLKGISPWPMIDRDGQLLVTNGYHPSIERIINLPHSYQIEVPSKPTDEDLQWAINLLKNDLLGDFPFSDRASLANTIAAMLQMFCSEFIEAPFPLHCFQAPMAGTGKSLLVKMVCSILFGKEPSAMTLGENDAETRKRISAQLFSLSQCIFLDNLPYSVKSHSLAAALTTAVWSDRILGVSTIREVSVNALWMATGNNISFSNELARRIVPIELQPADENPSTRSGFRHPNLGKWVQDERSFLIRAILILIRHWIAVGKPKGTQAFGSYESYAAVIGGILDAAGIEGFLENRTEEFLNQDDETSAWIYIVKAWYRAFGENPVGAGRIAEILDEDFKTDFLSEDRNTSLGMRISRVKNRVFAGLKILPVSKAENGSKMYRLQSITGNHTPPTTRKYAQPIDDDVY